VYSRGIVYSTTILLASLIVLLASLYFNKWKLNKRFGAAMLTLWVIVTVFTCLFEYDVFGKFSIPLCE
jgi:Ca2+/Na+ antiporter